MEGLSEGAVFAWLSRVGTEPVVGLAEVPPPGLAADSFEWDEGSNDVGSFVPLEVLMISVEGSVEDTAGSFAWVGSGWKAGEI